MAAPIPVCFCGNYPAKKVYTVECSICQYRYHGSCVGVLEIFANKIQEFHCVHCMELAGPTTFRVVRNSHRHDPYEEDPNNLLPVQTGTPTFLAELKKRHFSGAEEVVKMMRGQQLSVMYLKQNGFSQPLLIEHKDGLDMVVPPETFGVVDLLKYLDPDMDIPVIHVQSQADYSMKLKEFIDFFEDNKGQTDILNVLSLEFSNTKLGELVEPPYVARQLDWNNSVWPKDLHPDDEEFRSVSVQKYCLMSMENSYTDFHIDFGGTSVWYHVLKGKKIFYLIPPTPKNLSLYERWMVSSTKSQTFFADQVDKCYQCILPEGHTLLLPTGWIHAVLTPMKSLVFGGNFLHSLNIPMQLQVHAIELNTKTVKKFRYPHFEIINWYAAARLLEELNEKNACGTANRCPSYLLAGLKILLPTLKQWLHERDAPNVRGRLVPSGIEWQKLLKDLQKEIRHAERIRNSLNPPKPERESKRKRKKPVDNDFVDITQSLSVQQHTKASVKINLKALNRKAGLAAAQNPSVDIKQVKQESLTPQQTKASVKLKLKELTRKAQLAASSLPPEKEKSNKLNSPEQNLPIKLTIPKSVTYPYCSQVPSPPTTSPPVIVRAEHVNGSGTKLRFTKENVKSINVYDFHESEDDNDESLKITDHTVCPEFGYTSFSMPSDNKKLSYKGSSSSFIPVSDCGMLVGDMDVAEEVDVVSDATPKNGIDDLLKASSYGTEERTFAHSSQLSMTKKSSFLLSHLPTNNHLQLGESSDPASPSTREAVDVMLHMGQDYFKSPLAGSTKITIARHRGRRSRLAEEPEVEEEKIGEVHQDDDYVYPALDASDDEDMVFKPRGKKKMDEAWNPKARVGPVVPKTDRPIREGTKVQSVEKGLEAAAARRAKVPAPKRTYTKKKIRLPPPPPQDEVSGSSGQPLCIALPKPSSALPAVKPKEPKARKPKKGMATPKQRLGKILKIHKMGF